ncbi:MAG TPA: exopolyphosphatase, partial [Roseateles sp.]|nr:exopolyphosphatase [Roseateles sp.]
GRGTAPITAESFQVGSVSLSLRFFPDGRFTPEAFRAAQVAAGAELEEALALFDRRHWREALGSSGTVGAVAQVLAGSGITDGRITPDALRWCIERCLEAGHMDQLKLPGLKEDRRAVVGGGLCILYTLLTQFGIEALHPTKGALRQGVIFDLAERLEAQRHSGAHDMRDQSVTLLQQRFGVDTQQAERVAKLGLALYKQLQPEAPRELQRELAWAAALHEIGMMVSHHDHHRHSAYLLAHVDAAGFSQNQLRRLGDLALGQRGGLRKLEAQFEADPALVWQVLALRLAVLACHGRAPVSPQALSLKRERQGLGIAPARRWATAQPRALYLLREEAEAWSRSGLLKIAVAPG